jgi:hypothetical protein
MSSPVGWYVRVMVPARPLLSGRPGWVRSRAWICDFSSTLEHHGVGGGIDIEADDVADLKVGKGPNGITFRSVKSSK